ncbi:MAG: hypothetical protein LBR17_08090 [Bacteroidales bacterium]|jgi:hypothetical protein|nr:hypothetical protein [Bacteroidales bacterium]
MSLNCKYCGKEVKNSGTRLVANGNSYCNVSPTKAHVAVLDGEHCIYCGKEVKNSGTRLVANGNSYCNVSPTKKHLLG